jgi:RimJ/RimL family protein N-acetyltransferase
MSDPIAGVRGEHVALTPLTTGDLPVIFRWINDRNEVLWNAPYRAVTEAQHAEWFETIQRRKDTAIFGIRLLDTQKLIGSCQLHSINDIHRSAELQIRLGESEGRGHGYGTEAVQLLLDFAFKDLNLRRVCVHVLGTNERALRLYEKVGFLREGTLREAAHIDGRYVDIALLGILRDERTRS